MERSEVREWREAQARRLTAVDRRFRRERSEGALKESHYGKHSEARASERCALDLARGARILKSGGAALVLVVEWRF